MKNKKVSLGKLSCFSRASRKKGISAIVATVLIILITVAAVTIIWAAIIPMIRDQLSGATECLDASVALTVISDYSCYDATDNKTYIQIGRTTGDFDLAGISIIASYQGSSKTVEFNESRIPDSNGEQVYTINVNISSTDSGEFALDGVDEASVAAIVKIGNTQKTCGSSRLLTIDACA